MQALRRAGRHDGLNRVLPEVFFQETNRWTDPPDPGIGDEPISPKIQRYPVLEGFPAAGNGRHLVGNGIILLPDQPPIEPVRLQDRPPDHFRIGGNLRPERLVNGRQRRILRRINHRLPAILPEVFGEFHPALHPAPPGRWPVIGYDKVALHNLQKQIGQEDGEDADGSNVADEETDKGIEAVVCAKGTAVGEFVPDVVTGHFPPHKDREDQRAERH